MALIDTKDTVQRARMENWARAVDRHSDKELDADHDYIRVDGEMPYCPSCLNRPRAWLDRQHRCGVVRCCDAGCSVVTQDKIMEPVTSETLGRAWTRIFIKATYEEKS